jgi:hypothetical protein
MWLQTKIPVIFSKQLIGLTHVCPSAPLTSLDRNTMSPNLIITSSIDTTCNKSSNSQMCAAELLRIRPITVGVEIVEFLV